MRIRYWRKVTVHESVIPADSALVLGSSSASPTILEAELYSEKRRHLIRRSGEPGSALVDVWHIAIHGNA